MLGRLGLQLAGSCQIGHLGEVDAEGVLAQLPLQLTDAFQIGEGLDIAHRTADFSDDKVKFILVAQQLDVALDFVGDVRNDLDGLAQVVTPALLVDDTLVDASGCDVVCLGRLYAEETFVMPQVKVGLVAVYGDITFAVLVWIQGTRVDVDVRVKLLDGYLVTSCL